METDTSKCPLCGNEVRSEIVKRLRMQGIEVTAAHMKLAEEIDELKRRLCRLETAGDALQPGMIG